MKANEAPEKIYISYEGYGVFGEDGSTERTKTSQIEYIYADSFIEKACEWLKEYGGSYWMDDYDLPTDDLVDDFRKYMKGE